MENLSTYGAEVKVNTHKNPYICERTFLWKVVVTLHDLNKTFQNHLHNMSYIRCEM